MPKWWGTPCFSPLGPPWDQKGWADAGGNAQDSTPKWSRRGWIRHVLDEMKLKEVQRFEQLLRVLSSAGNASEELGETIDSGWVSKMFYCPFPNGIMIVGFKCVL